MPVGKCKLKGKDLKRDTADQECFGGCQMELRME